MLSSSPPKESTFKLTTALVSTFLLVNALVWYLSAFKFLQDAMSIKGFSSDLALLIVGLNFFTFVVSAFSSTWLMDRFLKNRNKLLKYWVLLGILVSSTFFFTNLMSFVGVALLASIIGAYFGLGMPVVFGYFAACTEQKNRAKFGGIVILLMVITVPTITILGDLEAYLPPITLMVWLAISLTLLKTKAPESKLEPKNKVSYRSVLSNRSFLLYIIPWLMFSLINELASQVIANSFSGFPAFFSQSNVIITNVIAGICAMVFGFLADKKGRKRLALIGFSLLGIGYAALGLFNGNYAVAWFYTCADGIAWGAFTMLFLTTLWGDIAQGSNGEKYYLLGVLPYLFSTFLGEPMGAYLAQNNLVSETTVFSFAAFFLFAATLPLFYAPETLSEKVLKDMDLMSYVEKAKKKAESETKKPGKKPQPKEEPEEPKAPEDDSNYEEARKLAEKYY
jgi:MFS family permease